MKNEVMAKAITGIDDKLIAEAQGTTKRSNKLRPLYSICALAACLVLVFTFIFAVGNSEKTPVPLIDGDKTTQQEPVLLYNGSKITQEPITFDLPITAFARDSDVEIAVDLSLDIKEPTLISVSKGKMYISSFKDTNTFYYSDTLYCEGTQYLAEIPVNIAWIIDGSDITKPYTLTLNHEEAVYTLNFDESTSLWSICKQ